MMGVGRQTLGRIENGVDTFGNETQISDSALLKLANLLGLDLEELFELEGRETDWKLSNMRSIDVSMAGIDLTGLSARQIELVEGLVEELKKGN